MEEVKQTEQQIKLSVLSIASNHYYPSPTDDMDMRNKKGDKILDLSKKMYEWVTLKD